MDSKKITVVGSYLVALVMDSERIPLAGETLLATNFRTTHGGKGSNQAVQAARLGARVRFVGRIGNDGFGQSFLRLLREEKIDDQYVFVSDDLPTGAGFIVAAADGRNLITIDIAAIRQFDQRDIDQSLSAIGKADIVLAQLEIPRATALYALKKARRQGAMTILNPAPAQDLSTLNLDFIDILTPNETEARICGGYRPDDPISDEEIARRLIKTGCRNLIITLGERGCLWTNGDENLHFPPFAVGPVVDSTGAGDAFNAGLATALAEGKEMPEAIRFANAAGALSVTRADTLPSYRNRKEVDHFIRTIGITLLLLLHLGISFAQTPQSAGSFAQVPHSAGSFAQAPRSASSSDLPAIVRKPQGGFSLRVDGKPYIILGAQLWNSSAWPPLLDRIWAQLKDLHANTLEAPVYWQVLEPAPGIYNFKEVDSLIDGARRTGLRLVLLWFGSYKNGSSGYIPEWMLSHPETYSRMQNAAGEELPILSALSSANIGADKAAFAALMRHLKLSDGRQHTVILVQVENECGSLGTDRDYSPGADSLFAREVPDPLRRKLGKEKGSWTDRFGKEAPEAFQAYYLASYVNEVAAAGRREYPLPMYTNDWLNEYGFRRPGEYPSGGPTPGVLDIWKATAPELSLLSPDIYLSNAETFKKIAGEYRRPDNPFLIPEMGKGPEFSRFQFYALGNYDALGVAPYGIDPFGIDPNDRRSPTVLDEKFSLFADNYRLLHGVLDSLAGLQGTGRLQAAGEEAGLTEQLLSLGDYDLLLSYGYPKTSPGSPIASPGPAENFANAGHAAHTGRVLAAQLDSNTFLLLGFDTRFQFLPSLSSGFRTAEILAIEEGRFEEGQWIRQRIWNGDEAFHSVLPHEGAILRIRLRKSNLIYPKR